ncbi:hypothetical protein CU102_20870 [Phyllobacterium brassicacearum]|uniref:Uncharacterized protein n=1 Tax=Phyllobacterium brassicacearum TaxID=314235 RepID=A0A2P7BEJ1_9HYPH|nr:hypothetical protein CU102_20870 [Phyllobacterium brassicacearum]
MLARIQVMHSGRRLTNISIRSHFIIVITFVSILTAQAQHVLLLNMRLLSEECQAFGRKHMAFGLNLKNREIMHENAAA